MSVIGFHYNKMSVDKKKAAKGKVNVSNNLVLTTVKEAKINLGNNKQKAIEFSFHFNTKYDPEIASIDLEGAVVFIGSSEKVKETLTQWDKEKKLPPDVLKEVYNHILAKTNVQTLLLCKEMQLPPHIPMPKVSEK